MSDTVKEMAKFNITKKPEKKTGTTEIEFKAVEEYMDQSVPSIDQDTDIYDAAKLLIKKKLSNLPVVDQDKKLIGFLSERDCLKHAYKAKYEAVPPGKVKDYMSKILISISFGTDIFDVVELFINNRNHVFPIVDDGKFVGVIHRGKALEAVCKMQDKLF